ncbi:DNA polymerase III subunit delta' [Tsuneonella deserti]|uniref:DNA polymerase III subunit delta n=1 Tax=Tsuneonella deserti TaxID=2035528 RepID=A0ABQ1S7D9_9SPHN|nr:AAA family ATPase [Tsuneonella deserti]GGD92482.1 DNA polymerase III subunit delta' [Tsuneonella deserti]
MTMLGHEAAWLEWRKAMAGPRMHHAWLLAGKKGLGKSAFALAAARELVAEAGVVQPTGAHPDVFVLSHLPKDDREEKKREAGQEYELARNIKVGQIRDMQRRLATRPTLGARRVIIIDPADDLETSASNALLKSLEEPPAGTHFLLIAHRPARLLPTIRSRCRVLRFAPLPNEAIDRLLVEQCPDTDPATREAAVIAAAGSPGAAMEFVSHDLGPLDALMRRITADGDPQFTLRGKLAEAIGARPDRARIAAALDLARASIARMSQDASRAQLPSIVEAHAELVKLAGQAPTYNFDPGLLVMQIGGLLASAGAASHPADA